MVVAIGDLPTGNWTMRGLELGPRANLASFDGGGVRGVVSLIALDALQQEIGPEYPLQEWASGTAGSSVGAKMMATLLLPREDRPDRPFITPLEYVDTFADLAGSVFRTGMFSKMRHMFRVKYSRSKLDEYLGRCFYDYQMQDLAVPFATPLEMIRHGRTEMRVFRGGPGCPEPDASLLLYDVIGGATACHTYFNPIEMDLEGAPVLLRDGGIFCNNASTVAYNDFMIRTDGREDCSVVSIGSGLPIDAPLITADSIMGKGAIASLDSVLESTIGGRVQWDHMMMEQRLGADNYVRIQPDILFADYTTDDTSRIPSLINSAQLYCEEHRDEFVDIARLVRRNLGDPL